MWRFTVVLGLLIGMSASVAAQDKETEQLQKKLTELLEAQRERQHWPLDKLTRSADVVLMARCEKVGAGERKQVAAAELTDEELKTFEIRLATMQILSVIKGEVDVKKPLEVPFLTFAPNVVSLKDLALGRLDPTIRKTRTIRVEFADKPPQDHATAELVDVQPSYLLFLKRRGDGGWEPASGHLFSAHSFRMLAD